MNTNLNNKTLGTYLKKIRLDHNLNQTDFGRRLGVNRSAYANYERDIRKPNIDFINKLNMEFGVNIIEMFNEDDVNLRMDENLEVSIPLSPEDEFKNAFKALTYALCHFKTSYGTDIALTPFETQNLYDIIYDTCIKFTDSVNLVPFSQRIEYLINNNICDNYIDTVNINDIYSEEEINHLKNSDS